MPKAKHVIKLKATTKAKAAARVPRAEQPEPPWRQGWSAQEDEQARSNRESSWRTRAAALPAAPLVPTPPTRPPFNRVFIGHIELLEKELKLLRAENDALLETNKVLTEEKKEMEIKASRQEIYIDALRAQLGTLCHAMDEDMMQRVARLSSQ